MSSNTFGHKNSWQKILSAQFQVQELPKLFWPGLKLKIYITIRIFYNFLLYIKPRYNCCHLQKKINKKTHQNFMRLKPAKKHVFDWMALWKFLIFIIRFSRGEVGQVSGTLFMVEFGQILPFSSTHHGFFLLISIEICWDIKLIFITCVIIL